MQPHVPVLRMHGGDVRRRHVDASPWLAAVLLGFAFVAWLALVRLHADNGHLTLHGRLTATEEEADGGAFTLEVDEIGPVTINPGDNDYLRQFLKGSVGSGVTVTIGPTP